VLETMDAILELLFLQQDPPETEELPDLLGIAVLGHHSIWGSFRV